MIFVLPVSEKITTFLELENLGLATVSEHKSDTARRAANVTFKLKPEGALLGNLEHTYAPLSLATGKRKAAKRFVHKNRPGLSFTEAVFMSYLAIFLLFFNALYTDTITYSLIFFTSRNESQPIATTARISHTIRIIL